MRFHPPWESYQLEGKREWLAKREGIREFN